MGFKQQKKATFTAPVKYDLPGDMGQRITGEFIGTFARLTTTEVEDMLKGCGTGEIKDAQVVERTFRGWGEDVTDESDAPWPFNEDNLKEFLEQNLGMRSCIAKAFFDNYVFAPAKNSAAPSVTSSAQTPSV
ncbi:MAG TPA: hypothetical protein VLK85_06830 [Ramlibacter sp.]|nr:hypothetical protein [Ramlibacter sp.]